MDIKPQLIPKLKSLRLSGILETLDVRNRQAIDDKLSLRRVPRAPPGGRGRTPGPEAAPDASAAGLVLRRRRPSRDSTGHSTRR